MPYFYVLCVTKGTSNSGAAKINVTAVAYYVKWMKKKNKHPSAEDGTPAHTA
jgi:uncharacterized membrane protein YebE (DUF533 family)